MKKTVNCCGNCPFLYSHYDDWAVGYSTIDICNLSRFLNLNDSCISVHDGMGNDGNAETPEWCPLKKEEYSFKFKVFSEERLQEIESTQNEIEEMEKSYDMREDEVDYESPEFIESSDNLQKLYTKLTNLYESEELPDEEVLKNEINDGVEKINEQLSLLKEISDKLSDTFNKVDNEKN